MMKVESAEFSKNEMIRLCHSALDSHSLRVELLKRLQTVVPFDNAYFSTTDPATLLGINSVLIEDPPTWLMPVFLENEYLSDDFNQFSSMVKNQQTVAVLSHATGHNLHNSPRYRDMLIPMAMEDELRAIFVSDLACWGTLCLHREPSKAKYSSAEADFLIKLAPHIADGLRKALLLHKAPLETSSNEPGVLILTDDLSVVAMTDAAEYWLMELAQKEKSDWHELPLAVRSVVAGLKAIESGITTNSTPKVRLHMRSGCWLTVYASRLKNSNTITQISVIFEIAQSHEIAPLMMQSYLFTKREAEITQCVLRGWSTAEISAKLYISANTVQDHLKAIFEKVDVSSRGELCARIFMQHY